MNVADMTAAEALAELERLQGENQRLRQALVLVRVSTRAAAAVSKELDALGVPDLGFPDSLDAFAPKGEGEPRKAYSAPTLTALGRVRRNVVEGG